MKRKLAIARELGRIIADLEAWQNKYGVEEYEAVHAKNRLMELLDRLEQDEPDKPQPA